MGRPFAARARGIGARRAAAATLAALTLACAPEEAPPARTNLLLVSLDTVRADRTSLLGHERPTTPNLEALARGGASYERAYAMTSTTGPSHATLFTGHYAPAHGVARNGMSLPETAATLAELLATRGYETAGFLGSFVLSRRFGFDQGFATFDEDFRRETSSLPQNRWEGRVVPGEAFDRTAAETTDRALAWLRERPADRPFLLFVHYFDAHEPYTPSAADLARVGVAAEDPSEADAYDAEIGLVDFQLGRLLAGLEAEGVADHTLVVVTSDHGQGLSDHDDPFHSVNLYEESVRAVLVLRGPRIAAGHVSAEPVEAVDVLPTVLDALEPGSHGSLGLPGRSLLAGPPLRDDRPIHLYRQLYPRPVTVRAVPVAGAQFGVRVGSWKYVEAPREGRRELYDLASDPRELRDLADQEPERVATFESVVRAFRAAHGRPGERAPALSDADRERLRALGYVE